MRAELRPAGGVGCSCPLLAFHCTRPASTYTLHNECVQSRCSCPTPLRLLTRFRAPAQSNSPRSVPPATSPPRPVRRRALADCLARAPRTPWCTQAVYKPDSMSTDEYIVIVGDVAGERIFFSLLPGRHGGRIGAWARTGTDSSLLRNAQLPRSGGAVVSFGCGNFSFGLETDSLASPCRPVRFL